MLGRIHRDQTQRLSLIHLADEEIYYEEFFATYFFGSTFLPIKGALHFCSQSFIFVPEQSRYGILKFPFDHLVRDSITEYKSNDVEVFGKDSFSLCTKLYLEMKKDNKDHPYLFNKMDGREKSIFALKNTALDSFFKKIDPIMKVWKSDKPRFEILKLLRSDFDFKQKNATFDLSRLEDHREQRIRETNGFMVTPLQDIPGRILLTNERIYFQPFYSLGSSPVKKFSLKNINRVVKRRYILRQIGFEIFTKTETTFLCMSSQEERDMIYNQLVKQDQFNSTTVNDLSSMTIKWQNGLLSNFDYLMFLNFIADRTFNDITQYPVFPWVIADYTSSELDLLKLSTYRNLSQPIGAINPKRLNYFRERFQQMWGDEKFLYGTHYSCPGYVLYFLVRQAPEYLLHLQNGKFDDPDRSFFSINETWESVLLNNTDLKELIPEFYQSSGEFLSNSRNLPLGTKSNGKKVHHVVLPNWAKDERDFITKNRTALESEYVSGNLHNWIDLIFGYKQRGEEAIRANNLFHPLTYEGNCDLEKLDPKERSATEIQIKEFGQCPKQLFTIPHPKKVNKKPFPFQNALRDEISLDSIFFTEQTDSPKVTKGEQIFDFNVDQSKLVEVPKFFTNIIVNDKNFLSYLKSLKVDQTVNLHKKYEYLTSH